MGIGEYTWGSDKKAVAVTEQDFKSLVAAVVEGVTRDRQVDLMDEYKRSSRMEVELARARDELNRLQADHQLQLGRKDAEVVALRTHVDKLSTMITTLASGQTHFQVASFPERVAASAPVPALPLSFLDTMPLPPVVE